MLTSGIKFISFKKKKNKNISKILSKLLNESNPVLNSLSKEYKDSFKKKKLKKFNQSSNYRIIGMGGSSLGAQTIYYFLKHKVNKKFHFVDNLQKSRNKIKKKNYKFNYF